MRSVFLALVLAGLVAGCGSGDDSMGGPDAGPNAPDADPSAPDADPSAPDAAGCSAAPDPAPTWLTGYQDEIVAKLSGEQAIDGVFLADRATPSRRAIARDYLAEELTALGYTAELHAYGSGANVWAELAATDSGTEWVVIGAHYDTVSGSPGANDNATGVAMVLAAARYLRSVECRTVSFLFVLFDEEEIGLVGSNEFAALLAGGNRDIAAVHTIDQMGWDQDGDRAIELERPSTGLYELYTAAAQSGSFGFTLHETNTGSTDHVSFRQRGFRAIGITEEYVSGDTTPHYHLPGDTYDTVSFAYLASTTALLHHTMAEVATGARAAALPAAARRSSELPAGVRSFEPGATLRPRVEAGCRHH